MATILLTGARGMLGRRLREAFAGNHRVIATARTASEGVVPLDITDAAAVDMLMKRVGPDWIVNAAAYTAVDKAESEAEEAFRVNATGAGNLARSAAARNARLLHFSTDFVFRGDKASPYVETDEVGPVGAYARSKEAGEREVREACPEAAIVRIAWLFGPDGKNFVDTILKAARSTGRLRVVDDQSGTPTFTADAAAMAVRIVEAGLAGTIHAANHGVTTWCGFAREAVRQAGLDVPVEPIRTADWPTPAARPANSALRNSVLERTIGDTMRPWPAALADHLRRSAAKS